MKKKFNHVAIVLFLAGWFTSCSNKMNDDLGTEKAILGKWELVEMQRSDKVHVPLKPNGYYEFRPDSVAVWYDYNTKHTIVMKYWLESIPIDQSSIKPKDNEWHLHFQSDPDGIPDGIRIGFYPELYVQGWMHCTFFSKNQIGMSNTIDPTLVPPNIYMYQRKK